MKILSIDIGIKNLAFCLFDERTVEKWDVIDLTKDEHDSIVTCVASDSKKGGEAIKCNKKAVFFNKENCFCKKHAKLQELLIFCPPSLKPSSLRSAKVNDLKDVATKLKIPLNASAKKEQILNTLNHFRENFCLDSIKPAKKVNCSKIDLVTIGKAIKAKFDQVFSPSEKIDCILIENQISPIANRMKAIQGMVAQYFIMRETCEKIEFVNAGNKLKSFDKEKQETYKDRKQLGVAKCIEELNKVEANKAHVAIIQSHKKKDDLADCFLQGIWYLNK
jgi:hypothetical protein